MTFRNQAYIFGFGPELVGSFTILFTFSTINRHADITMNYSQLGYVFIEFSTQFAQLSGK